MLQLTGLLPSGFALPPVPYLVAILLATAIATGALFRVRPPVTERTVLALVPWMLVGASLYALFQAGAIIAVLAPLFSSPAVYLTTLSVAGVVWAVATVSQRTAEEATAILAAVGIGVLGAVLVITAGWTVLTDATPRPFWPAVAGALAIVLTAVIWGLLNRFNPSTVAAVGLAGPVVVLGQVLDAVSTAVGRHQLAFAEQTPLSALLLEAGESLFVAPVVGGGWLFVLVKAALAVAVLALLGEYVREAPASGYLVLAGLTAVGLGPGAHNLVLFTIASP